MCNAIDEIRAKQASIARRRAELDTEEQEIPHELAGVFDELMDKLTKEERFRITTYLLGRFHNECGGRRDSNGVCPKCPKVSL